MKGIMSEARDVHLGEGPHSSLRLDAQATTPIEARDDQPHSAAVRAACLNCGTPLGGPFCRACGQRDIPPYPSVRELAVDAFSELSGWDGRFVGTVRALFRQPGMLTREFLEGRRVRYISPLRLYLLASLVYFVLAAAAPTIRLESGKTVGLQVGIITTGPPESRPERLANAASAALQSRQALTATKRQEALADIENAPPILQPLLQRAVEDPAGFRSGVFKALPRLLFVLLPVLAAIVALFYRGRKYPEHLYFAIHLNAFIFLAVAATQLVKFTREPAAVLVASVAALISLPIYATLALRRVYGGSLVATLLKEVAIATIYCSLTAVAFIGMIYLVSIAG